MVSRFVKLHQKSDLDEQRGFQSRVAAILGELYPEKLFTAPDDPLILQADGHTFGLTNLLANFLLGTQSDPELRHLVDEHFRRVFSGTENVADYEVCDWEQASGQLMPQLMPDDFLSKLPLVSSAFGDGIHLGFVLDTETAYKYVAETDLAKWGVGESELRAAAMANLMQRSQDIQIAAFPGENGLVIINTMDGFDAARIVLPEMQAFIAEIIGTPFRFGIPNRDFLICWTINTDLQFQSQMMSQISSDFDERPYPLSRNAFEMHGEGRIEAVSKTQDERADVAMNN